MEPIVTIIVAVLGSSGLSAIVVALLNRHWARQDQNSVDTVALAQTQKALVQAQKVMMVDRVRFLGQKYIDAGEITLADKETLEDMHTAYKGLGGNGHLDTVMAEVEELPIVRKGV